MGATLQVLAIMNVLVEDKLKNSTIISENDVLDCIVNHKDIIMNAVLKANLTDKDFNDCVSRKENIVNITNFIITRRYNKQNINLY